MPRISIFFGIVIYMYYDEHLPSHFHAMYEGSEGMFEAGGNILKGIMAPRAVKLIKEWASCIRRSWKRTGKELNIICP